MPTVADVPRRELQELEERLLDALAKGVWRRFRAVVDELLEDHDPLDLAAAALALAAAKAGRDVDDDAARDWVEIAREEEEARRREEERRERERAEYARQGRPRQDRAYGPRPQRGGPYTPRRPDQRGGGYPRGPRPDGADRREPARGDERGPGGSPPWKQRPRPQGGYGSQNRPGPQPYGERPPRSR